MSRGRERIPFVHDIRQRVAERVVLVVDHDGDRGGVRVRQDLEGLSLEDGHRAAGSECSSKNKKIKKANLFEFSFGCCTLPVRPPPCGSLQWKHLLAAMTTSAT